MRLGILRRMVSTLIYLFESGVCLALLFIVYFLFLRKETYFTFNRLYLITILILSFLLPLLHLNLTLPQSKPLENSIEEINRLKNYYENLIALTDPDFENSFTKPFQENGPDGLHIVVTRPETGEILALCTRRRTAARTQSGSWGRSRTCHPSSSRALRHRSSRRPGRRAA